MNVRLKNFWQKTANEEFSLKLTMASLVARKSSGPSANKYSVATPQFTPRYPTFFSRKSASLLFRNKLLCANIDVFRRHIDLDCTL